MSENLSEVLDAAARDIASLALYQSTATLVLQRLQGQLRQQNVADGTLSNLPELNKLIVEFREQIQTWSRRSPIVSLAYEDQIYASLRDFIDRSDAIATRIGEDISTSRISEERTVARFTMIREQSEAYTNLSRAMYDYKDGLVSLRGEDADAMMNMLHKKTVALPHGDELRHLCWTRLLEIAIANQKLPSTLELTDITDRSIYPVYGGGFGDVYSGSWRGGKVAIKISRIYGNREDIHRRLCREILIWNQLSHPHVLPFLGVSYDFPPYPAIVSPWMANGDLLTYVRLHITVDLLEMLRQTASALDYLHQFNPTIIHRDLRCANILVNERHKIVLSDFGISSVDNAASRNIMTTVQAGNARWKAPELTFGYAEPSCGSDIWAFGMVVIEVYTKAIPFNHIIADGSVILQIHEGSRPTRPEDMDNALWELVLKCWRDRPEERISASELEKVLRELRQYQPTTHKVPHHGSRRSHNVPIRSRSFADKGIGNQIIRIYMPVSLLATLQSDSNKLLRKFEESLEVMFTLPDPSTRDEESRDTTLDVAGSPRDTEQVYREIEKLFKLERLASGLTWTTAAVDEIKFEVKEAPLPSHYPERTSSPDSRPPAPIHVPDMPYEEGYDSRRRSRMNSSRHHRMSYDRPETTYDIPRIPSPPGHGYSSPPPEPAPTQAPSYYPSYPTPYATGTSYSPWQTPSYSQQIPAPSGYYASPSPQPSYYIPPSQGYPSYPSIQPTIYSPSYAPSPPQIMPYVPPPPVQPVTIIQPDYGYGTRESSRRRRSEAPAPAPVIVIRSESRASSPRSRSPRRGRQPSRVHLPKGYRPYLNDNLEPIQDEDAPVIIRAPSIRSFRSRSRSRSPRSRSRSYSPPRPIHVVPPSQPIMVSPAHHVSWAPTAHTPTEDDAKDPKGSWAKRLGRVFGLGKSKSETSASRRR